MARRTGPRRRLPLRLPHPRPAEPAPTLEAELAAIRATPAEQVRADLDTLDRLAPTARPATRRRALRADPPCQLARIVEEIRTYWELALGPYWGRVRAVLDAEVFHRARQVAEHGAGHLFNDLDSTVSWDDNTLRMVRRSCGISREKSGAGLLLVPSAFATRIMMWARPPEPPQLAYPARGVGALWEPRPVRHADAIAAVLGRSRTRLLTELAAPASTTELAGRTGISPGGVSQHLTALRGAGMVSAHRAGRSVLYARTAVAESLLTAAG
ncbi:winged helix-turn-helix domain-containing protein [Streptomyces sp. MST-110588]|uniref:ArsR/SmtB family transcription factor n=1 Tax=Streptomyces sp. MST-110588 TaxID=2833628 RepID=UPI0032421DBE